MSILHSFGVFLILQITALPVASLSQNASEYMPDTYPAESQFQQTVTDADGDSEHAGPDVIIRLLSVEQETSEHIQYHLDRGEVDTDPFSYDLFAIGDTLYTTLGDLVELDFLEEYELDFDWDARLDILRLSAGAGQGWVMTEQEIRIPVPEEFKDEMPTGTDLSDSMDVSLRVSNQRLDDQLLELPYGNPEAVTFRPALSIDVTVYVQTFLGESPVTFELLEDYGIELQFSPGYGLVREKTEPMIVAFRDSDLDIEMEFARIEGREIVLETFREGRNTFAGSDHQEPVVEKPAAISLNANYPNPFNAATTLSFELSEPGAVDIRIYDQQGRLVEIPVAGRSFSTGKHAIRYQADNLSSGAYIYRIRFAAERGSGTVTLGGRFMLIK